MYAQKEWIINFVTQKLYVYLLDKACLILKSLFRKIHLSAFERDVPVCHQDQVLCLFIYFLNYTHDLCGLGVWMEHSRAGWFLLSDVWDLS